MYELLGNSYESDEFIEFNELCILAYLSVRKYYHSLLYIVNLFYLDNKYG